MSFEVTTAFVQQYNANVAMLLQQRGSRLRDCVTVGSYTGKAGKAVEQIGPVVAQKRTNRHADTPLISTPHDARWVFPEDYEWADMVDDVDKLRMLIDPTSPYAMNGAFSMGRAMDQAIIDAALGTSKTGENGTTNTVFDTTNQQVVVGTTGLTIEKLREARKILLENEVDEMDPLYFVVNAKLLDDMLGETEIISSDYAAVKALVQGEVDSFMGFQFKRTQLLGVDGSSDIRAFAFARSGMHLGIWNDVTTRIGERADKSYSTQVYVAETIGATRLEEKKVVEVLCNP